MKNFWHKMTSWQRGMFIGAIAVILLVLREVIVRTSGYTGTCPSFDATFPEACSFFEHVVRGFGTWVQLNVVEFLSILLFSGVVGHLVGLTNKRQ